MLQAVGPLGLAQPAKRNVQRDGGDEGIIRHLRAGSSTARVQQCQQA